jgi:hypothetical protein
VWSEFGRRAKENLNGTDHGAAGIIPDAVRMPRPQLVK